MVNIPDSMLLFPRHGVRRIVPTRSLVRMGIRGLNRAVERREVFHLWFHPSNFFAKTREQFSALEEILGHAQYLREAGSLDVLTFADIRRTMGEAGRSPNGTRRLPPSPAGQAGGGWNAGKGEKRP
jgi:hypothetical protein